VLSSDGSSWHVDTTNTSHWIPDHDTYSYWSHNRSVSGPWPASDVNQIPRGGDEPYRLYGPDVANSIICRNDGVCWVVDGGAVRHHIPTYTDNVCWRWQAGWGVSRSGLNAQQAASLPESNELGCNMNNHIIAATNGQSFYMQGNTRYSIVDPESYYCYRDNNGAPVIGGISIGEVNPIPYGGSMPQCLSRQRVKYHIVRQDQSSSFYGASYFVDGGGVWHYIRTGAVWNCLTARYRDQTFWHMNWTQINSIKGREGGDASCGM
jgi:hypothetical protein